MLNAKVPGQNLRVEQGPLPRGGNRNLTEFSEKGMLRKSWPMTVTSRRIGVPMSSYWTPPAMTRAAGQRSGLPQFQQCQDERCQLTCNQKKTSRSIHLELMLQMLLLMLQFGLSRLCHRARRSPADRRPSRPPLRGELDVKPSFMPAMASLACPQLL